MVGDTVVRVEVDTVGKEHTVDATEDADAVGDVVEDVDRLHRRHNTTT